MRTRPIVTENGILTNYRVGRFVWTVEGNTVLVTKDTHNGLFNTINLFTYADSEQAHDCAWRMACRQC